MIDSLVWLAIGWACVPVDISASFLYNEGKWSIFRYSLMSGNICQHGKLDRARSNLFGETEFPWKQAWPAVMKILLSDYLLSGSQRHRTLLHGEHTSVMTARSSTPFQSDS